MEYRGQEIQFYEEPGCYVSDEQGLLNINVKVKKGVCYLADTDFGFAMAKTPQAALEGAQKLIDQGLKA